MPGRRPDKPYIGSKSWRRLVTLPGHPRSRGTNALTRAIKLLVSARSAKTQKTRPDQKVVILPKYALKMPKSLK